MVKDQQIARMKVTVEEVYDSLSGKSQYGEWVLQPALLKDETGTIRAAFMNPARNVKHLKGNEIEIISGLNGKGKFSGITATDYSKDGKTTRQLKVSEHASIDEITNGGESEPERTDEPQTKSSQPKEPKVDHTRVSIEAQVALKAAIDLAIASNDWDVNKICINTRSFAEVMSELHNVKKGESGEGKII